MNGRLILALTVMVCLSWSVVAIGQKKGTCRETAVTQSEMNQCASSELQAAEAESQQTYADLLQRYGQDSVYGKNLEKAQQAWLAYRDAHLGFVYPETDAQGQYGSVHSMCRQTLLTALTEDRAKTLKQIQAAEEGDVCLGHLRANKP